MFLLFFWVLLVCLQEAFGFIERGDIVKEIFFHYSEFKGDLETLQPGDDVEFTIKDRNVRQLTGLIFGLFKIKNELHFQETLKII